MKNIQEYEYTGGGYAGKVSDDMLVSVPYTDQSPFERIRAGDGPLTIANQMFDPKLSQQTILANTLGYSGLNNLKAAYESLEDESGDLKQINAKLILSDVAIKQENIALREKADSSTQISLKMMLASLQDSKDISEIREQLNPTSRGGEQYIQFQQCGNDV